MSSTRTLRLIEDAYKNDDINAARSAMSDYYNNHCLHPVKQLIHDSHMGQDRYILVSCGRCIHCIESKINEWCTRMYAHAEDFKNVYFITLTYRSITNPEVEANKLLLGKLSQAVWHRDSYNSTKHLSYNPCVLCKSHYQNFIKRLRKNTGLKDISYVLSGEYGDKFGRPHFHLIIFTNGTLTKSDIVRAWSVCLWKSNDGIWSYRTSQKNNGQAFNFPIGNVDFHDLTSNGSFNTTAKVKIDGRYMNVANCFSYVAKYVVKRNNSNLSRVSLAYRNLFHKETFVKLFNNEVSFKIAHQWLLDHGYNSVVATDLINNQLKRLSYEKTIFQPCKSIYEHGLCRYRHVKIENYEYDEEVFPSAYFDFKHMYRPFCEFSRGCPIGSVYAKRNIQEFTQGVFTKPLLQDSGFVVPSYFRKKARNYVYGFREVRKTLQGTSFAIGSIPDIFRRIQEFVENDISPFNYHDISRSLPYYSKAISTSPRLFADVYSGERITFDKSAAHFYRYSRKKREYLETRVVPIIDFIMSFCDSLNREMELYKSQFSKSRQNMRERERALLILTDLGDDEQTVTDRFAQQQKAYLENRDMLYKEAHASAE